MNASAILSVMMGGALNGASAPSSSLDNTASALPVGSGEFAAMLDSEIEVDEVSTAATSMAATAMAPAPAPAPATQMLSVETATVSEDETGTDLSEVGSPLLSAMPVITPSVSMPVEPAAQTVNSGAGASASLNDLLALQMATAASGEEAEPLDQADANHVQPQPASEDAPLADDVAKAPIAKVQDSANTAPQTTQAAQTDGQNTARQSTDALKSLLTTTQALAAAQDTDAAVVEPEAQPVPPPAQNQAAAQAAANQAAGDKNASPLRDLSAKTATKSASQSADISNAAIDDKADLQGDKNGLIKAVEAHQPATQKAAAAAQPVAADAALASDLEASGAASEAVTADAELQSEALQAKADNGTKLSLATIRTTAEIAAHFITKMGQRSARFDMILTPETLGNVEVFMEVGHDGQVQARLVFDNPAAAQELRSRADELRRQLTEAGFQLSENALEFSDREGRQRDNFNPFFSDDRSGRRAFAGGNRLAEAADAPIVPVWNSVTLTPRGVDLKV